MMDELKALALALAGIDPMEAEASKPDWLPYPFSALNEHDRASEILVVGDVHGRWEILNRLIAKLKPTMVLQVGDFGFFPRLSHKPKDGKRIFPLRPRGKIENSPIPIYFCDGNHEDHKTLAKFRSDPPRGHKIAPGVFYQERGSTITLPDGRTVLFFGGAASHDAHRRKEGRTWFPQEVITEEDLARLPDGPVDIVISHQSPFLAGATSRDLGRSGRFKYEDPGRKILDEVFLRYRPRHWFFGHWHCPFDRARGRTKFHGLDKISGYEAWTWLPAALPPLDWSERDSVLRTFAALCADVELVTRAYVTGSYARGDCTARSDLNACLKFEPETTLDECSATFDRLEHDLARACPGLKLHCDFLLGVSKNSRVQPIEDNLLVFERPAQEIHLDRETMHFNTVEHGRPVKHWLKIIARQVKNIRIAREQAGRNVWFPHDEQGAAKALEEGQNVSLATLVRVLKNYCVAPWLETLGPAGRARARLFGEIGYDEADGVARHRGRAATVPRRRRPRRRGA